MMASLVLYKKDTCPFCLKVMNFIQSRGMEIEMRDTVADPSAFEELVLVGGKAQVPCLFIDGKPLYESGDIIDWLDKNYSA